MNVQIPIGPWAKGRHNKEIGLYYRQQFLDAVEPYSLSLYTNVLGYSREQAEVVMAGVRKDLQNPDLHMYVNFHFTYGRKVS
jgi:hypothetical protein